jgi:hypothetical protein
MVADLRRFAWGEHEHPSTKAERFLVHEAKVRGLRAASAPGLERDTSQAQIQIRDRRVTGAINGLKVDAIPDTGADASFISAAFLNRLKRLPETNIKLDHHTALPPVKLASGKTITPTSTANIPWRFDGERPINWITCLVLPKCAHDLILGDAFLHATQTLTTFFKTRVSVTLRSLGRRMLLRLNYMGASEQRRVCGKLDGETVSALPDSGSDVMAVSAEYARRRGFCVQKGRERQVEVQFADGSSAWTEGVVRGLEWEFGDAGGKVVADFYVLGDLPVDVLFSSDFLFEHDVFGMHDEGLRCAHGSVLDLLQLCSLRLLRHRYHEVDLDKLEEEGLSDGKCCSSSGLQRLIELQ